MELKPVERYPTTFTTVRQRRKVNWVLVVSLLFIIAGLILACVSVATDYWVTSPGQYAGLWKQCRVKPDGDSVCVSRYDELNTYTTSTNNSGWIFILACRILLLVAVGLAGLSLLLVALALCHKATRCCAVSSGVLLIFALTGAASSDDSFE